MYPVLGVKLFFFILSLIVLWKIYQTWHPAVIFIPRVGSSGPWNVKNDMGKCQEAEKGDKSYRINGGNDEDAADNKEGLHVGRVLSRLDQHGELRQTLSFMELFPVEMTTAPLSLRQRGAIILLCYDTAMP